MKTNGDEYVRKPFLLYQIEFRLSEDCDRLGDSSQKAHIGCDLSHQRRSKYLGKYLREHLVGFNNV